VGFGGCVFIPDAASLVDAVLERSTGKDSFIYGESHWQRVAAVGLALLPDTPDTDPLIVFLLALFHDSMMLNDGRDPLHGPRGAKLARELRSEAFVLDEERMGLLGFVCEEHTNGSVTSDPTVGVCWDSDRLNLWRVGIRPDPRWLSTEVARSEDALAGHATCSGSAFPGRSCVRASTCSESDLPILRLYEKNKVLTYSR
jgi:uncharacterized protein